MSTEESSVELESQLDQLFPRVAMLAAPEGAALASAKPEFDNEAEASGSFVKRFKQALRLVSDKLPPKEVVLEVAERYWDRYVATLNIPNFPDFFEPAAKEFAKRMVLRAISRFYDSLVA